MTITIDLPTTAENELRRRAKRTGKSENEIATDILQDTLRPFEEIVAPIHEAFRQSGMTQEELDDLTDELIREVRAETPLH
jgi:plasmid stability protein